MEDFKNIINGIKDKIKINKIEYNKFSNVKDLAKIDNKFKNHFYFENENDNCFFNNSGLEYCFTDFYNMIIKSGVGTIILGGYYAELNNKYNKFSKKEFKHRVFDDYKKIIKIAHISGTKIFLKIKTHYGRYYNNKIENTFKIGSNFGLDPMNNQNLTIRINDYKCNDLINEISQIGLLSTIAGFDGIMIDATFSNLIGELSSIEYNKRIFGYFSETTDFIKKCLSRLDIKNNIILLKLSILSLFDEKNNEFCTEKYNNAFFDNVIEEIKNYISMGIDGFEFDFGAVENDFLKNYNSFENDYIFEDLICLFKEKLKNIKTKKNNDIIIFYHDNFNSFDRANELIDKKIVNFIDITKDIYADNNFIKKIIKKQDYNKCIKCLDCDLSVKTDNKIECSINPTLNNFENLIYKKTNETVAVIGSGYSGLICALTLAKRGFIVKIFEKNSEVNHLGNISTIFNFDKYLLKYNESLKQQINSFIKNKKIELFLNTMFSVSSNNINEFKYLVVATGFKTKLLQVNGAVQKHVVNVFEVLNDENVLQNKNYIVIYIGSILSLKLALYLSINYKNITVILNNEFIYNNKENANFHYIFYNLSKYNANFVLFNKIHKINDDNIDIIYFKYENNKFLKILFNIIKNKKQRYTLERKNIDCDLFIYDPETEPNNKLYYDIVKENYNGEVYLVGNALQNLTFNEIIKTGYYVGKNI